MCEASLRRHDDQTPPVALHMHLQYEQEAPQQHCAGVRYCMRITALCVVRAEPLVALSAHLRQPKEEDSLNSPQGCDGECQECQVVHT